MPKPFVYVLAALCSLFWAGAYVTGKTVIGTAEEPGFGPFRAAFLRFLLSGVLLFLWKIWREPRSLALDRTDRRAFFLLGLLGLCLTYVFNYGGIALTTGTAAALLMATEPVWIAVLAVVVLRERMTAGRGAGIGFGLVGTILVVLSTSKPAPGTSGITNQAMLGNLLIVLSLLFESASVLLAKRLTARYSGSTLVTYQFLIGSLLLTPFAVWETVRSGPMTVTTPVLLSFLYLIVACTLFGYTVWFRLLRYADASELTVFIFLQPVIGTFLGVWLKNDPFTPLTLLGAVCVLLGMVGILRESATTRPAEISPQEIAP